MTKKSNINPRAYQRKHNVIIVPRCSCPTVRVSEAGCRLVEDKAAPFPRCCAREECEEVAETVARAARRILGNIAS